MCQREALRTLLLHKQRLQEKPISAESKEKKKEMGVDKSLDPVSLEGSTPLLS